VKFWTWFFRGLGGKPGIRRGFDRWVFLHIATGLFLAWAVPKKLEDSASTVLLPLAGTLIGLSFAWGGNAQALLQTKEIERVSAHKAGGLEDWAYAFQSSILSILSTLALWGLAGLGVPDTLIDLSRQPRLYFVVESLLFASASYTLRECWHVVLGAQSLLLIMLRVRKHDKESAGNADSGVSSPEDSAKQ
jgi:hypothetical protein